MSHIKYKLKDEQYKRVHLENLEFSTTDKRI